MEVQKVIQKQKARVLEFRIKFKTAHISALAY